jgi:hypothetical protein
MSIVIPKPAKNLPKSLTDMTAGTVNEDPISTFASKIEKVDSRKEVDNIMKGLANANGLSLYCLGGAVVRAQELFATKKSEFEDCKSFRDYIEADHGIRYHKAMRAAQLYRKLLDLNLPWSELESVGWSKVLLVLDVVTKENIKHWIAKAKAMNCPSLKVLVDAEKHNGEGDTGPVPKAITSKTFKLHADQKELVEDVLLKVSEVTGSDVDSVNLEAVFQSYLSGGGMYADVSDAMAYAAKHADDPLAFVEKQVATLQHLFPQLNIAFEITSKKSAASA